MLTSFEVRKATLIESAVYSTCHQAEWPLPAVAPTRFDLQAVLLVQGHGMLANRVLHWGKFLIVGVRLFLLDQRLAVLAHDNRRLCHAVVVLVELPPGPTLIPGGLQDEDARLAEDIRAFGDRCASDGDVETWQGGVDRGCLRGRRVTVSPDDAW